MGFLKSSFLTMYSYFEFVQERIIKNDSNKILFLNMIVLILDLLLQYNNYLN